MFILIDSKNGNSIHGIGNPIAAASAFIFKRNKKMVKRKTNAGGDNMGIKKFGVRWRGGNMAVYENQRYRLN